ncbi:MAG: efflux transporter outer membrane subunit [Nitrospirota bacterium]
MKDLLSVCLCAILLALCSCAVGPDYRRPDVTDLTPADWRWKVAEPKDDIPKGEWWRVFSDPVLDELEVNAMAGNQNLRAAVARVDEARAIARISRSQFFPELSLDPSFRRERTSGNLPTPIPVDVPSAHINTYSIPIDLSYEVDLWGRVRRSFESARAQAEASISDYQNVLLMLTADVAVNYYLIRSLDSEIASLRRTVESQSESVRLLNDRFLIGVIAEIDVVQAKAELAGNKAEMVDTIRRRTETLHALALLCGKPAGSFEISERPLSASPPIVPAGLPSSLLERRPDIARAERSLAARNAQIGVAKAAYFPAVHLTGQAGYLSAEAGDLISADSRVWSIGPGMALPLFNAGRIAAGVEQTEAAYQEALAEYRQTVITAFKEVEDSLAEVVLRKEQAAAQAEAFLSSSRVTELARARYGAGTVSRLELLDAERNMLRHERRVAQLDGRRFTASVRLIKALGGGWKQNVPSRSDRSGDSLPGQGR